VLCHSACGFYYSATSYFLPFIPSKGCGASYHSSDTISITQLHRPSYIILLYIKTNYNTMANVCLLCVSRISHIPLPSNKFLIQNLMQHELNIRNYYSSYMLQNSINKERIHRVWKHAKTIPNLRWRDNPNSRRGNAPNPKWENTPFIGEQIPQIWDV
jgi:hypothetical protein